MALDRATTTSRPSSTSRRGGWCPEQIWNGKSPGRLPAPAGARGVAACPHHRGNCAGSVPSTAPRRPPRAHLQRRRRGPRHDPLGTPCTEPAMGLDRCQCRRRGGLHTHPAHTADRSLRYDPATRICVTKRDRKPESQQSHRSALSCGTDLALQPAIQCDLTETLYRLVVAGRGVAWLPGLLTQPAVDEGLIVRVGGGRWEVDLEVRLYRRRSSQQGEQARAIWTRALQRADNA